MSCTGGVECRPVGEAHQGRQGRQGKGLLQARAREPPDDGLDDSVRETSKQRVHLQAKVVLLVPEGRQEILFGAPVRAGPKGGADHLQRPGGDGPGGYFALESQAVPGPEPGLLAPPLDLASILSRSSVTARLTFAGRTA